MVPAGAWPPVGLFSYGGAGSGYWRVDPPLALNWVYAILSLVRPVGRGWPTRLHG